MDEISKLLKEYYKRRKAIENSFAWRYDGSVEKRVKYLVEKYKNKILQCQR
jgi:hypothetical protein